MYDTLHPEHDPLAGEGSLSETRRGLDYRVRWSSIQVALRV
jgi:hypothetical protein